MAALAWGDLNLYEIPGGGFLWGREFELLPSGSMMGAAGLLHGLIGVDAEPIDGKRCQIQPGSPLLIYGIRGTVPDQLREYQEELADEFNAQVVRSAT